MTEIETDRLLLRQFRESDLDPYAEMCADPEVMRFLGGETMSREEAWRHMADMLGHWHLRGYGMYAVEEKVSGRFVGRIGFYNPEGWPGFEIGWSLARGAWGRGFATEGARAALGLAFTQLDRAHVISLIQPDNARSIRVAERVGEKLEGTTELLGTEVLVYGLHRTAGGRDPAGNS